MVVLNKSDQNIFAVYATHSIIEGVSVDDQITLRFSKYNENDDPVYVDATVTAKDCFNNVLTVTTLELTIDTGEYKIEVGFDEDSEFGSEYGDEYHEGELVYVVLDNANVILNTDNISVDDNGVVKWDI